MAARTVEYHLINPYKRAIKARTATIYAPDVYKLHVLTCSLSPIAIRVLLVMAANVDSDGKVSLKRPEIAGLLKNLPEQVTVGVRQLVQYDFIARHRINEYWLSPDIFQPILLEY